MHLERLGTQQTRGQLKNGSGEKSWRAVVVSRARQAGRQAGKTEGKNVEDEDIAEEGRTIYSVVKLRSESNLVCKNTDLKLAEKISILKKNKNAITVATGTCMHADAFF